MTTNSGTAADGKGADQAFVLGISSSALFDTRESDACYRSSDLATYVQHQLDRENEPFPRGTAFPLVEALMRINDTMSKPRIRLVVMSKNEPEVCLRVSNSLDYYGIKHYELAFTGGESVAQYCKAFEVSLFLSREESEVQHALKLGVAAGILYEPPEKLDVDKSQLRIAFDWDGVLGSTESERIFRKTNLAIYREHETKNEQVPITPGPCEPVLKALVRLRDDLVAAKAPWKIEIAVVTARNAPVHRRVLLTLRAWGLKVDQIFGLGTLQKKDILKIFRPHIFFDDQEKYALPASEVVSTVRVPWPDDVLPAAAAFADPKTVVAPSDSAVEKEQAVLPARGVSVEEFVRTSREILIRYQPSTDGKRARLSPRALKFIDRNKRKTALSRGEVLDRLKRFDLSFLEQTHDPMFNREREDIFARKMEFIENGSKQGEMNLDSNTP